MSNQAIDLKAIQAGKIARQLMDGIQAVNQSELNILNAARQKLAEVICHYETKVCDNCSFYKEVDMDGEPSELFGYCVLGVREAKKGFGCNKHSMVKDEKCQIIK